MSLRFWSGASANFVHQHSLSRSNLEAIVRQLLLLIEENGYGLFRVMNFNIQEWSYMVRKPADVKMHEGKAEVVEMTDPRLILHDPRACGALMFSAYQFLI